MIKVKLPGFCTNKPKKNTFMNLPRGAMRGLRAGLQLVVILRPELLLEQPAKLQASRD